MAMLYLLRHGEAQGGGADAERVLTPNGAADVERLAAWAAGANVHVAEICHSGKRRAEQTATIFSAQLKPRRGVTTMKGIDPDGDPAAFAETIAGEADPMLIVSHLPFLDIAVAELTGTDAPQVYFHPATLVALVPSGDRFVIDFVVYPALV
jgi:phosphohistidine phosphatase